MYYKYLCKGLMLFFIHPEVMTNWLILTPYTHFCLITTDKNKIRALIKDQNETITTGVNVNL